MNARMFEVTLISGAQRVKRLVISTNSIQAIRTALNKMPEEQKACAIICKPLCALADELKEEIPCAA